MSHDFDSIIRYAQDEMDDEEIVSFFQDLVDTGLCWKLQGHYGRVAISLIENGLITVKRGT